MSDRLELAAALLQNEKVVKNVIEESKYVVNAIKNQYGFIHKRT